MALDDPANIAAVKALDRQIFAMLSSDEETLLNIYRNRGRKYGVSIKIINEADPVELGKARSQYEADQILKRTNSRISVFEFSIENEIWPEVFKTDDISSHSDQALCADGLLGWSIVMAGHKHPANFGEVMQKIAARLGINGKPESFSVYAQQFLT